MPGRADASHLVVARAVAPARPSRLPPTQPTPPRTSTMAFALSSVAPARVARVNAGKPASRAARRGLVVVASQGKGA